MKIKTLLTASLLLLGLTSYASKTLIFATEATYPPFVSMDANGQMVGFDADLVHKLCQQMHARCELVNAPWDSLIPSLQIGKYDALFGGMGITPEREKVIDFTQAYYIDTGVFMSPKAHPLQTSPAEMKGKVIGVQGGTFFAQYMQKEYGNSVTLKLYASNMQAILDLQSGRLDGVMLDAPVAALWLKKHPHSGLILNSDILDPAAFGLGNGIAVRKNETALLAQLNQGIDALRKSGELAKMEVQYFGVANS